MSSPLLPSPKLAVPPPRSVPDAVPTTMSWPLASLVVTVCDDQRTSSPRVPPPPPTDCDADVIMELADELSSCEEVCDEPTPPPSVICSMAWSRVTAPSAARRDWSVYANSQAIAPDELDW